MSHICAEGAHSSIETRQPRALVRFPEWGVSVLCWRGHAVTSRELRRPDQRVAYAGSRFAAEVAAHPDRHGGFFDRLAWECCGGDR